MTCKVLLIDPCLSDRGISNTTTPLSIGLVGSYLNEQVPDINVTLLKSSAEIISFIDKNKPNILGICSYFWNSNTGIRLSHYARQINPRTFIVFGGPEINKDPVDRESFLKKYYHADMLVEHEGEIAFSQLVKIFLEEDGEVERIRLRVNELGNCFFINDNKQMVSGPEIRRIANLDEVPSPYLTGLFDKYLDEGVYQPLIQTNRGCPYSCTFCQEGNSYYSKVHYRTVNYVTQELDYIAERVNPGVGLWIVDSNWGMYKQDVEIAHHLRKLKSQYNWPMYVHASTGKSQLARIKHVCDILDGSLRISNAVQSLNNDVLDAVKRKNARDLDEFLAGLEIVSEPDIILPLPEETLNTFITGLNRLLDTKSPVRFTVFPGLLLSNTEMNDISDLEKHGMQIKYRQHNNLTGQVAGELVCEVERNIVATTTMSQEDVLKARQYVVLMDALIREEPLREIFNYLDSKDVRRSAFVMSLYNHLDSAPRDIKACFDDYVEVARSEVFDTEDEVASHMKDHITDYTYGKKGGDLLRYSQKLWIDHFDSMMNWSFQHLGEIVSSDEQTAAELACLREFFTSLYWERSFLSDGEPLITRMFDYDILAWLQDGPNAQLSNYKNDAVYDFHQTKFSSFKNIDIWKSFGFNLDKDDTFNPFDVNRAYLSRTRREISRADGLPITLRGHRMNEFADKVGSV